MIYTHCVHCKQEFSKSNTFTTPGWDETQISGLCERCFDSYTQDLDDDGHDLFEEREVDELDSTEYNDYEDFINDPIW